MVDGVNGTTCVNTKRLVFETSKNIRNRTVLFAE